MNSPIPKYSWNNKAEDSYMIIVRVIARVEKWCHWYADKMRRWYYLDLPVWVSKSLPRLDWTETTKII